MKSQLKFGALVVVAALALFAVAPRSADAAGPIGAYPHCFVIDTYPYTITTPGVYCLGHKVVEHFGPTAALITIKSNDVTVDLNGATLIGDSARVRGMSYGVLSAENKNVTVRNGTIRGFDIGVSVTHFHGGTTEESNISHGLTAENLKLYRNKIMGLRVEGNGSIIRDNEIMGTGGFADTGGFHSAMGILTSGKDVRLLNNEVMDTRANDPDSGRAYAVYILHSTLTRRVAAINNRITQADFGIFMPGGAGVDWGKYRDNVTIDVGVSYTGGSDIGNNS